MGDKQMGLRLCATGGFLDDTWFNRTYWMYAAVWPGFYIAHLGAKSGQLLAVDRTTTYGVQAYPSRTIHSPTFKPNTTGYLLFADDNANDPVLDDRTRNRDKGMGFARNSPPKWFAWVPVRIRAMVAAGETLFAAGPPDVVPPDDPYGAFEGRMGAKLLAFATADGRTWRSTRWKARRYSTGWRPPPGGCTSRRSTAKCCALAASRRDLPFHARNVLRREYEDDRPLSADSTAPDDVATGGVAGEVEDGRRVRVRRSRERITSAIA